MPEIQGLITAIEQRAWYPLIGFVVTILLAVWARWQPRLFEPQGDLGPIIPVRIQWLPALVLSGLSAFVVSWTDGLSWQMAVGVALYTMALGGPASVGLHRIRKEAGGRTTKANLGKLSAGSMLLLVVLLAAPVPGCATAKPILRNVHDVARSLCAIYYTQNNNAAGLSVDDAAQVFCRTEEQLRPWLDEALRAQRTAGAKASAQQPAE